MFYQLYSVIFSIGLLLSGIVILYNATKNNTNTFTVKSKSYSFVFFVKGIILGTLAGSNAVAYSSCSFFSAGLISFCSTFITLTIALATSTLSYFFVIIDYQVFYSLLIGIGGIVYFLFMNSDNDFLKRTAMFAFGLGILLFGINQVKLSMSFVSESEYIRNMLFAEHDFLIAFVLIGAILTFIIQSGSTVIYLTYALVLSGALKEHEALMIIYGCCVGSGLRIQLYAFAFNGSSRRILFFYSHLRVLNGLMLILFFYMQTFWSIPLIDAFFNGVFNNVIFRYAASSAVIYILILLLFLPFINWIDRLYKRFIPDKDYEILKITEYINDIEAKSLEDWQYIIEKIIRNVVSRINTMLNCYIKDGDIKTINSIFKVNVVLTEKLIQLCKVFYAKNNEMHDSNYFSYELIIELNNINKALYEFINMVQDKKKKIESTTVDAMIQHINLLIDELLKATDGCVDLDILQTSVFTSGDIYYRRKFLIDEFVKKGLEMPVYKKLDIYALYNKAIIHLNHALYCLVVKNT